MTNLVTILSLFISHKNRVILLFVLAQLTIGYEWASMAHIWNSADLTKPLSIAKPWIHQLSLVLELILGRPQVTPSLVAIAMKYGFTA